MFYFFDSLLCCARVCDFVSFFINLHLSSFGCIHDVTMFSSSFLLIHLFCSFFFIINLHLSFGCIILVLANRRRKYEIYDSGSNVIVLDQMLHQKDATLIDLQLSLGRRSKSFFKGKKENKETKINFLHDHL